VTELNPGAAAALALELEASGVMEYAFATEKRRGSFMIMMQSFNNIISEVKGFFKRSPSLKKRPVLPNNESGVSIEMQQETPSANPLWLLCCINGRDLAVLEHLDISTTKSDNELFVYLKKTYLGLRSEAVMLKRWLTELSGIHFVEVTSQMPICKTYPLS
jgi:hypothetical protein